MVYIVKWSKQVTEPGIQGNPGLMHAILCKCMHRKT